MIKIIQIATAAYGDKDSFNNEVIGLTEGGKVIRLTWDEVLQEYVPCQKI